MAADRTLEETGVHKEDRKQYLDQVAAVFILQGYLDAAAHKKEQQEESES
jgi:putative Holliday junction resolvase